MTSQSTAKMLARMAGKSSSSTLIEESEELESLISAPQLHPSAEMEHILSNILGASASKKYSPLD